MRSRPPLVLLLVSILGMASAGTLAASERDGRVILSEDEEIMVAVSRADAVAEGTITGVSDTLVRLSGSPDAAVREVHVRFVPTTWIKSFGEEAPHGPMILVGHPRYTDAATVRGLVRRAAGRAIVFLVHRDFVSPDGVPYPSPFASDQAWLLSRGPESDPSGIHFLSRPGTSDFRSRVEAEAQRQTADALVSRADLVAIGEFLPGTVPCAQPEECEHARIDSVLLGPESLGGMEVRVDSKVRIGRRGKRLLILRHVEGDVYAPVSYHAANRELNKGEARGLGNLRSLEPFITRRRGGER
jgi:hypothetical protein